MVVPADLPEGTDIVGIRPDSVKLAKAGPGELGMTGIVELIEPVGGESHLYLRVEGLDYAIIVVAQGRSDAVDGARLDLTLPRANLHPFNSATGRRLDDAVSPNRHETPLADALSAS